MATPPEDGELEALLDYVRERRNFDFRGYKRASLTRRVVKRMQAIGVDDYQRYMEILEANPGEFAELFNTILINVTALLRDRDAWDALADEVIPRIVEAKEPGEAVRVWSAGCASGEEAYSLAVLLAEAFGEERFRQSVKIYATDADEGALADARRGRYGYQKLRGRVRRGADAAFLRRRRGVRDLPGRPAPGPDLRAARPGAGPARSPGSTCSPAGTP